MENGKWNMENEKIAATLIFSFQFSPFNFQLL